jgi:bifunctional UDP-N-acetylglucosamine pyrophosphorylase / glucosamine-1-phosphate N-acetyltransferase
MMPDPTTPLASPRSCLAVVLAAGEGTRMNSALPKVLHRIAGRSMLGHVLTALCGAGASQIAVVVGPDREDAAAEARRHAGDVVIAVQHERLGTAHAVLAARDAIGRAPGDILVAFADTPLILPETLARLRAALAEGAAVAVLGFEAADPRGYGRLVMDGDTLVAIREENDASHAEAALSLCNGGLMALAGRHALAILDAIGNANAKGEYYLTDAVEIARAMQLRATAIIADEDEVMGVNDRAQLARAEACMQDRLRHAVMRDGVTLVAPETVFLSADTVIGRDAVVEPHVFFGPGVRIEDGAVIHAFSYFEGARIGRGASVGPFARLRPGADLGVNCHIGNFVEVKNATFGEGAKANHLTYVGDATIGAKANIGAGTITSNYDGFGKYRTVVGEGAFIGSNSALVAPVTIGAGAYVGSGSVVTSDVPADALALGRGRQVVKADWAKAFRETFANKKKDKT